MCRPYHQQPPSYVYDAQNMCNQYPFYVATHVGRNAT